MCEQSGVGRKKLRDEFLLKPITAPVFKYMVGGGVVVCVSECMQWWVKCGRRQTVSIDTGSCSGPCFLLTNPHTARPIQNTFLSAAELWLVDLESRELA